MEQTNVLVTGGCGFLGTAIVSALLETKRYNVTAIDINPPSLGSSTFPTEVRYVRANVLDREALQKVFDEARPAIVVHTVGVYPLGVARYSMKGKDAVFKVNVEGTRNVLEATKECGAKGLVFTSSVTVVLDELKEDFKNIDETWPTGRAETSYGLSKVGVFIFILYHMIQLPPYVLLSKDFPSKSPTSSPQTGPRRIPHPLLHHTLICDLRHPFGPNLRSQRPSLHPRHPRLHRSGSNALYAWLRYQPPRLRLRRQRRRRTRARCG